jgi:drug/metabolite transporter (DMT)-like permease
MSPRAWAAFAAMSVLWGGSYLLIEIAERDGLPALWVAWVRIGTGALALLILAARAGTLPALRGRGRWLLAYAVSELVIPFPMIALGETHVASSLTAIIIATVPLFGALLALRFDHEERPTPIRALGLGLGFVGVVALVGLDVAGHGAELLGVGAILLAAVGYAIAPLILKHRLAGLDPRAMMAACLTMATIVITPAALLDLPARGLAGVGSGRPSSRMSIRSSRSRSASGWRASGPERARCSASCSSCSARGWRRLARCRAPRGDARAGSRSASPARKRARSAL